MNTRPFEVERLAPGTRVRYDYGKWQPKYGGMEFDPNWSTREWAYTITGTVITPEEYSPYPDSHAWGCPHYATPIRYDDGTKSWARTSCLDVIGFEATSPAQPELQLAFDTQPAA